MGREPGEIGAVPIHVWIVCYNSARHIDRCLASLPAQVERVVILDNGSEQTEYLETRAIVDAFPRAHLHRSDANLGFGAGVNRISELDPTDDDVLVWILNPDTVTLRTDALAFDSVAQGSVDILSPLISYEHDGEAKIWFAGGSIDAKRGRLRHDRYGEPLPPGLAGVIPTRLMTGASPIMRRSTWRLLGGFREDLFLYWEDVELSLRAGDLGLSMAVDTRVLVRHDFGGSSRSPGARMSQTAYYYTRRNRVIVCVASGQGLYGFLARSAFETVRSLMKPLIQERDGRFAKFGAAVRGLVDGIRLVARSQRRRAGSADLGATSHGV